MFKLARNSARTFRAPNRFAPQHWTRKTQIQRNFSRSYPVASSSTAPQLGQATTQIKASYKDPSAFQKKKGPNDDLVIFLIRAYEQEHNKYPGRLLPFKKYSFQRAIAAIRKISKPITSSSEAKKIPGIGAGIARRIDEYFLSWDKKEGSNMTLGEASAKVIDAARRSLIIKGLTRIYGVGETRAVKLYDAGCRTIEDIKRLNLLNMLTQVSQVAYDYVDDLEKSVTKEQAERVKELVEQNLSSDFEVHHVGAFRRGLDDSPVIELLLFHPHYIDIPTPFSSSPSSSKSSSKGKSRQSDSTSTGTSGVHRRGRSTRVTTSAQERQDSFLVDEVVKTLMDSRVIEATMSESKRKWSGIVRVPTGEGSDVTYRRMDIHLMPHRSKGAALLSLTGDKPFLNHVSKAVTSLGYHLDEFGLWCWKAKSLPNNGDEDSSSPTPAEVSEKLPSSTIAPTSDSKEGYWSLITSESEETIFEELGLEFVVPEKRTFAFIITKERGIGRRR